MGRWPVCGQSDTSDEVAITHLQTPADTHYATRRNRNLYSLVVTCVSIVKVASAAIR